MEKFCSECGAVLRGRVDKKFCSDQCRSAHNNKLRSDDSSSYIRNINNILRRNRKILLDLNPKGKVKVSREKLMSKGFNFSLHTSCHTTRDGAQYYYCYEQGYLTIEKDWLLLVIKKDIE